MGAELDEDLAFRFNNTDVLFDKGEQNSNQSFRPSLMISSSLCANYHSGQYRDDIRSAH